MWCIVCEGVWHACEGMCGVWRVRVCVVGGCGPIAFGTSRFNHLRILI